MPHLNLRLNSEFDSDRFRSHKNGEISETAIEVALLDGELITEMGGHCRGCRRRCCDSITCAAQVVFRVSKRKRIDTPREAVKKYIGAKCEEEVVQAQRLHDLRMDHEREFQRRRMECMEELHQLDLGERKLRIQLIRD